MSLDYIDKLDNLTNFQIPVINIENIKNNLKNQEEPSSDDEDFSYPWGYKDTRKIVKEDHSASSPQVFTPHRRKRMIPPIQCSGSTSNEESEESSVESDDSIDAPTPRPRNQTTFTAKRREVRLPKSLVKNLKEQYFNGIFKYPNQNLKIVDLIHGASIDEIIQF